MDEKLYSIFKLKSFRPGQEEVISAALDGRDVLALMPTGGGKSLCFQLPAVCVKGRMKGVIVVISPLRALMHDQIDDLHKKGIDAILASPGYPEYRARLQGRKLPSLVYVTPEMPEKNRALLDVLSTLNDSQRLAQFVVDEAHCFPGWGKDFRKDYDALGTLKEKSSGVPIMALTASATRPNLIYSVLSKPKGHRKAVGNIATSISSSHADHSDKADVRYVPRNLVGLYQETGRASRDGNPADCILCDSYTRTKIKSILTQIPDYRHGDFTRLIYMIRNPTDPESTTKETREEQEREAHLVMQYCVNNIDCRRQQVLSYFGENVEASSCNAHCDSCLSDALVLDQGVTSDAINIVNVVGMLEEGDVTIEYCRDVFRGKTTTTVRGRSHHMSRLFGLGRRLSQTLTERLFSILLSKRILDLHFSCDSRGRWHTTYVKLGPAAQSFLLASEDKQTIFMKVRQKQESSHLKTSKQAAIKRPKPLRQKYQVNESESEDDLYVNDPRDEESNSWRTQHLSK
ncbi:ATP-dependent DNA helicase [Desarmillaria ectypa]|nr:ATP-dependent DNA helicase [Desarmillaria ectypa]